MRGIGLRRPAGGPNEAPAQTRLSAGLRWIVRPAIAIAAAACLLLAVSATDFVHGANTSLVIMGFDPDRAQLITSFFLCGATAFLAYLCSDRFVAAVLVGLLAGAALYAQTFAQETTSALAQTGAAGVFDPGGWIVTLATLLFSGIVVAWSAATICRPVRRHLVASGGALVQLARERKLRVRALARPVVVVLVAALLAVCGPTLGDMLNYTPDSHMLGGGAPLPALDDGPGSLATPSPSPTPTSEPVATPSGSPPLTPAIKPVATPSASPSPTPNPGTTPWVSWKPSGEGQVVTDTLAAPWVGGTTISISVYLPPGYQTGHRHYPVLYEPVFSFGQWDRAFNAKSEIDLLIAQGTIPASLVVFIDASGGPYPDSECANSSDGQEWMGRFIGATVPAHIDATYRTIARPAARTLIGFSQGGYCAAILALNYPDVFGNAISFSGYYHAGVGATNAWRPFGRSQDILDQNSPTLVAPRLPADKRSGLYFVVEYDPSVQFDAREADGFVAALKQSGYSYTVITSALHHSWTEVRQGLGPTLALVGGRQAAQGVFG
jgi:enterochelin esterase-like enzyme